MLAYETSPAGISAEDWAKTPAAVRALVMTLVERLARLEERLNQTSQNSSKPPSADPPYGPPRPARTPSGRKAGGQPGHLGHGRKFKPVEDVDRFLEVKPTTCEQCGSLLLGEDSQPERHQVVELPRIVPLVTEYRRYTLRCLACGGQTQAPWPTDMPPGQFWAALARHGGLFEWAHRREPPRGARSAVGDFSHRRESGEYSSRGTGRE